MIENQPTHAAALDLEECAAIWTFFHDLFRFPTPEQWRWLQEERIQNAWASLAESFGHADLPTIMPMPSDAEAYQQEYLQAFEAGMPQPLCPLIESHWRKNQPVPETIRENLLFYRYFGLEPRSGVTDTADHLLQQLEFLAYLCRLESMATHEPSREGLPAEIARGRHDFLSRHPGLWLSKASAELGLKLSNSWPAVWMELLDSFCQTVLESDNHASDSSSL